MSTSKLILGMTALVLPGVPMVWYLWEVVNNLLSGVFDGRQLLIAVPVLIVFLALLRLVSRTVRRWEEEVPS